MPKNFLNSCFYNETAICLLFDTPMQTTGKNSILDSRNFTIFQSSSNISLENLVSGIYSYHTNYVTFLLKKNAFSFLKDSLYIKCSSFKLKEIFYIKDFENNILDFNCPTHIELQSNKISFETYIAKLINPNELILENNKVMRYKRLYPSDFYIEHNGNIYFPSHIKVIDKFTFSFIFKEKLLFKRSNIITLKTIENCKSIDLLGETIKGNDSLNVLNTLNPYLINISIISYRNETLKLLLEFTDKLLRFDGKDFIFFYNNQKFSSKESSRFYNNDYLELSLDNISDFNPYLNNLMLLENKNLCSYTIDENYNAINFSTLQVCHLFYSQRGSLIPVTTISHYNLDIAFNKTLSKISNSISLFATACLLDDSELSIKLGSFGYITIFGTKLLLPNNNINYPFTINTNENILTISLDLSLQNLININQNNISYIDFTPSILIKSSQNTHAFQSYESPIIFKKEKNIICRPDNQGDVWSLLGQNISLNTILQIDKETTNKF
ncbi:MAG: hypothetical protein ACRC41_07465, partial [Sarcina sp.]